MKIPIGDIRIGERDRSEIGDVDDLAASIKAVGLLHPIVITEARDLVAGERRLAAVRQLGWSEVEVTIVTWFTVEKALQAEADENLCRKPLTPYEASRMRERRIKALNSAAVLRKPGRPPKAEEGNSSNLDEFPRPPSEGAARKVGAQTTGYSGSTLDKVDKIRDVAERGVVKQGKAEISIPEPVREVARKALEEVKVTGAAVEGASRKVEQALTEYIEEDPEIKNAKFRASIWKAIKVTGEGLPLLDVDRSAAVADEDLWDALAHVRERLTVWLDAVESKRPRGLRVVGEEH